MTPIAQPEKAEQYRKLAAEMMLPSEKDRCEFSPDWIRGRGWKVVPAEQAGGHFPMGDIPRVVSALKKAGHSSCIAVATEPVGDMADCYVLSVTDQDFQEFNRELGPFRFLLMDEQRSWAISCTEWYNLFAGSPEFLESMLGKTIEEAHREYLAFALEIAKEPDEPLVKLAERYRSL